MQMKYAGQPKLVLKNVIESGCIPIKIMLKLYFVEQIYIYIYILKPCTLG